MSDNLNNNFTWDFDSNDIPPYDLWLFKWEATNIYDYIFETDDLNLIRGASQLLKNFKDDIKKIVNGSTYKIQTVYNAASQFLAIVNGNEADVKEFGGNIIDKFSGDEYFGTSAYGIVNLKQLYFTGNIKLLYAIQQCEEQILRKRLRSLDVYPGANNSLLGLDEVDKLRLADKKSPKVYRDGMDNKELNMSSGTYVKFNNGKDERWGLIEDIYKLKYVHLINKKIFFQDISSLSKIGVKENNGYISFITVDGNGFTKERENIKTLSGLCEFSVFIENIQKKCILNAIEKELNEINVNIKSTQKTAQPVQLLYMAGDEFDLIVRGNRGIDVVNSLIFNFPEICKSELKNYGKIKSITELEKLSISVGLVFAHANTPIKLIREAAHELRKNSKNKSREDSIIDFMVFESHPTTSDGINEYRKKNLENGTKKFYSRPYIKDDFVKLMEIIIKCKQNKLPKTQLYKLVSEYNEFIKHVKQKSSKEQLLQKFSKIKETIVNIQFNNMNNEVKSIKVFLLNNSKSIIDFYELYDYVH
ncbi:hypothetical protein HY745_14665 [Candidatus Desantisbacteria bacterium]|nr:hypothetical protein [Candidatus Desantisbacteria bacterium]